MDLTNLHEIQRSILEKLGYEEEKGFSELQGDLPSNKVAFHINQLKEKELIEKVDDKYTTTKKGREAVIEFLGAEVSNPVTLLSLMIFKDDKICLEKQTTPQSIFKNMYKLPTDKVRKRERLKETAERIYRETTGEEPGEFEHLGYFDKEVTLKDGVKQIYLLFYMKIEYEGEDEENFFSMKELKDMPLITGVEKAIRKVYEQDTTCFNGEWEVKQTEDGFDITKFEI